MSVAGLFVSAAFLAYALKRLNWADIKQAFESAQPWPWIPLAVLAYLAGQFVRGIRCRFIVLSRSRISVLTAGNVVVVGYAANNVLPARLGELVRAGLLAERAGIPLSQSLAITFLERVLDGWILLFLLGAAALTVSVPGWAGGVLLLGLVIFVAASLLIMLCVLVPNWVASVAARTLGIFGDRVRDRTIRLVVRVTAGLACLRSFHNTVVLLAQSLVVWTLEGGMFLLVFPAFGIDMNPWWAFWAMAITNLGILAPSSPGYIGTFHLFCKKALTALGVADATALCYAAAVHLTFYIPVTLWGLGAMLRYGIEIGAVAARARASKKTAGPTPDELGVSDLALCEAPADFTWEQPNRFILSLSEALLPHVPGVPTGVQAEAVRKAASFAQGQIESLPAHLVLAFRTGAALFNLSIRFRSGKEFIKLPLERRRAAAEAWAYGGSFMARQLFRPVRCCALLAYYEHPTVRDALEGKESAPAEPEGGAS